MHGTMNLKFINAKQAKEVYEYKNIKQILHNTTAAIWYNKTCRVKSIKSSNRPKLEETTNATTHGDWRLYVQI
jgi:predicted neuraminidase